MDFAVAIVTNRPAGSSVIQARPASDGVSSNGSILCVVKVVVPYMGFNFISRVTGGRTVSSLIIVAVMDSCEITFIKGQSKGDGLTEIAGFRVSKAGFTFATVRTVVGNGGRIRGREGCGWMVCCLAYENTQFETLSV